MWSKLDKLWLTVMGVEASESIKELSDYEQRGLFARSAQFLHMYKTWCERIRQKNRAIVIIRT